MRERSKNHCGDFHVRGGIRSDLRRNRTGQYSSIQVACGKSHFGLGGIGGASRCFLCPVRVYRKFTGSARHDGSQRVSVHVTGYVMSCGEEIGEHNLERPGLGTSYRSDQQREGECHKGADS